STTRRPFQGARGTRVTGGTTDRSPASVLAPPPLHQAELDLAGGQRLQRPRRELLLLTEGHGLPGQRVELPGVLRRHQHSEVLALGSGRDLGGGEDPHVVPPGPSSKTRPSGPSRFCMSRRSAPASAGVPDVSPGERRPRTISSISRAQRSRSSLTTT